MSYGGNQGISGIDTVFITLGAIAGSILVGTVVLVVFAAKWAVHPVLRSARASWIERNGKRSPLTAAELAPNSAATSQARSEQAATASSADRSSTVELRNGGAMLHIRYFGDVVRAHVVLREAALVAQHGKRVDLPPVTLAASSVKVVEAELVARAQEIVEPAAHGQEKPQEGAISSTGSDNDSVQDNPAPVEQKTAVPELPKVAPRKAQTVRHPRGGLVSYQGVLRRAAVERRTGVKEPYDCYCVTIADEALGHDQQLWGTDLERAVEQSGAEIGDAVRVSLIGETPVHHKGRTTHKKIWSVERVAA
ncbi:MAG: hypothetical protein AzoDbin1_01891 [Azoarcus sp.]|nr:hypothetical protein [Azoarcus sp.]